MHIKTIPVMTRAFACAALLAFSAACDVDSLLEVTDPSRLLSENVEIPAQAGALMNGLEADFLCAHGAFLVVTANLSDEYEDTNAGGDNWSLDRRRPQGQNAWADNDCTAALPSAYVPASRARWVADNLTGLLEGWSDAEVAMRTQRLARASLLAGFSLSMLGAAHCTIALDSGPEITAVQAFAEAEQRFSNALQHAQSSGAGDIGNAALVGRARVKLYQGDGPGAVADARQVPEGFRMDIYPSDAPNRLNNRVWATNLFNFTFGIAPWTRELMTGGVPDPRTTTYDTGQNTGWAPGNVWGQSKYTSASSPMPIARWEEAQLIIAEVAGGDEAVNIINALRDAHGLPHFMGMGDAEIRQAVIDERQRELWFEGFRAYDIHRLSLPLVPAAGEPYQLGVKGGSYGDQTCVPIPIIETFNNPTIRGGA